MRGIEKELNSWIERTYTLEVVLFGVKMLHGLHIILKEDKILTLERKPRGENRAISSPLLTKTSKIRLHIEEFSQNTD